FAEEFGVPYETVRPSVVDTDSVGYTDVTGGSRTAFATGYAAIELAKEMKQAIAKEIAGLWEVDAATMKVNGSTYSSNGKSASVAEVAKELDGRGKLVTCSVTCSPKNGAGAFGTHIADVEVDPETGKVDVIRYTAVQDCGKAIHPSYCEGQIHGGVAQGIG